MYLSSAEVQHVFVVALFGCRAVLVRRRRVVDLLHPVRIRCLVRPVRGNRRQTRVGIVCFHRRGGRCMPAVCRHCATAVVDDLRGQSFVRNLAFANSKAMKTASFVYINCLQRQAVQVRLRVEFLPVLQLAQVMRDCPPTQQVNALALRFVEVMLVERAAAQSRRAAKFPGGRLMMPSVCVVVACV